MAVWFRMKFRGDGVKSEAESRDLLGVACISGSFYFFVMVLGALLLEFRNGLLCELLCANDFVLITESGRDSKVFR